MADLSYKEACYGYMITVADEDNIVTAEEKYVIDHYFDQEFHFISLSGSAKRHVGSELRIQAGKPGFYDMIVASMKKENKNKQMIAYQLVCKFVNMHYPENKSAWAVAELVRERLDFTPEEYHEFEVWKK